MENSTGRKILLCLLDCIPKSAQEIADNIGAPLETVEAKLTRLASENICEAVNSDEDNQWAVRKDIETFVQLVQKFISSDEPSEDEKSQFVTSVFYLKRIDLELVDFIIDRFHLDLVYRTDDEKEVLRRLLLASPSGLRYALHRDTQIFDELQSSRHRFNASDSDRQWFAGILTSEFQTPLVDMLITDMKVPAYGSLYAALQLRVVKISSQISLATLEGKFVEAYGGAYHSLNRAAEGLRAGQSVSPTDPLTFSDLGVALLHLGEIPIALKNFDKALSVLKSPIQKAIVWNNKGLIFLRSQQYQKAIQCFDAGIEFDSEGTIPQLLDNRRVAEEYMACATDADNLDRPTRIRFVQGQPVPVEETLFYEFKEIKGNSNNPVSPITNTADEYAVAFLNGKGGRIFWGIRNSDRITVGVPLDEPQRDEIRTQVSQKLWSIRPPIVDEDWHFEFHNVYDLQGQTIENLWVIELVIAPSRERSVFYTNSGELFVKTDGGKQKLLGPQVTEFVRDHFRNETD